MIDDGTLLLYLPAFIRSYRLPELPSPAKASQSHQFTDWRWISAQPQAGFEINSRKVQRSPSQAAVPQKSRATFADPRTDEAVQEEHCQSMITSPPTLLTRTSVDALIGLFEDELR